MKNILLLFIMNLNLVAQWNWFNPSPIGNPTESVFFVNENVGWMVGAGGSILKTTDGGIEWEFQECGLDSWFQSVSFIDQNTGWVVGGGNDDKGSIIMTKNSGESWETIETPYYSWLYNVYFKDHLNGWITGDRYSLVTTNGGDSWDIFTIDSSSSFGSIYFIDSNIGWITAEKEIFKTYDGGTSWNKITLEYDDRLYLGDLYFLDANIGWITERDGNILYTIDGGYNWTKKNIILSSYPFYSIHFIDNNNGFAVGPFTGLYITRDGGDSWQKYKDIDGVNIYGNKIIFHDNEKGLIAGKKGKIYKTNDSGLSWSRLTKNFSLSYLNGDDITDIDFMDQNVGCLIGNDWAYPYSGSKGKTHILNSSDGGINWEETFFSTKQYLNSLQYSNTGKIWAVGDSGMFLKSINNGISWNEFNLSSQSIGNINDVFFITDEIGWISGSGIFKTTDGGSNWENIWQGGGIESVFFNSIENGWFCNTSGSIYHTSDGGQNWTFQFSSSLSLNKIVFNTNNHGIAVGREIAITTDGGIHWEQIDLLENTDVLYDVYFLNDSDIIGVGRPGSIIISNDGGNNWKKSFNHIYNDIFCIDGIDNSLWIGGRHGTLLGTREANLVDVDLADESNLIFDDFLLHQNYPNPFNPSTKIKFAISKDGNVKIKIYDFLGREIKTVFNEYKQAGTYEINFNAAELSSGIYYYQISAGDYFETKKMVLLK
jgi:photosystem II stability/assembly factor-like uncharacterized protein